MSSDRAYQDLSSKVKGFQPRFGGKELMNAAMSLSNKGQKGEAVGEKQEHTSSLQEELFRLKNMQFFDHENNRQTSSLQQQQSITQSQTDHNPFLDKQYSSLQTLNYNDLNLNGQKGLSKQPSDINNATNDDVVDPKVVQTLKEVKKLQSKLEDIVQNPSQEKQNTQWEILYQQGSTLQQLVDLVKRGNYEGVNQAEIFRILTFAADRYSIALQLNPPQIGKCFIHYNLGAVLSHMGRITQSAMPEGSANCFSRAAQQYATSLLYSQKNPKILNNWGMAIYGYLYSFTSQHSKSKLSDSTVQLLLDEAQEKFRQTLTLDPSFDQGCFNLGVMEYFKASQLQKEAAKLSQEIQMEESKQSSMIQENNIQQTIALSRQNNKSAKMQARKSNNSEKSSGNFFTRAFSKRMDSQPKPDLSMSTQSSIQSPRSSSSSQNNNSSLNTASSQQLGPPKIDEKEFQEKMQEKTNTQQKIEVISRQACKHAAQYVTLAYVLKPSKKEYGASLRDLIQYVPSPYLMSTSVKIQALKNIWKVNLKNNANLKKANSTLIGGSLLKQESAISNASSLEKFKSTDLANLIPPVNADYDQSQYDNFEARWLTLDHEKISFITVEDKPLVKQQIRLFNTKAVESEQQKDESHYGLKSQPSLTRLRLALAIDLNNDAIKEYINESDLSKPFIVYYKDIRIAQVSMDPSLPQGQAIFLATSKRPQGFYIVLDTVEQGLSQVLCDLLLVLRKVQQEKKIEDLAAILQRKQL